MNVQQLVLDFNWGDLDDSLASFALDHLPELNFEDWVTNNRGGVGQVYTIYGRRIFVNTCWNSFGFPTQSEVWDHLKDHVTITSKPANLPEWVKLTPGMQVQLRSDGRVVDVVSIAPITIRRDMVLQRCSILDLEPVEV